MGGHLRGTLGIEQPAVELVTEAAFVGEPAGGEPTGSRAHAGVRVAREEGFHSGRAEGCALGEGQPGEVVLAEGEQQPGDNFVVAFVPEPLHQETPVHAMTSCLVDEGGAHLRARGVREERP